MTHEQAKQRGLAAAYVSKRLSPAEREAFEAHINTCGECWDDVEALKGPREGGREARRLEYWQWACATAAMGLLGLAGWAMLADRRAPEFPAQSNLPVLMLEAERTVLTVPALAKQVAVWIGAPPAGRPFRLELRNRGNEVIAVLAGLTPNSRGALTASVPAAALPPGSYTARLYAAGGAKAGEYSFDVQR